MLETHRGSVRRLPTPPQPDSRPGCSNATKASPFPSMPHSRQLGGKTHAGRELNTLDYLIVANCARNVAAPSGAERINENTGRPEESVHIGERDACQC